MNTDMCNILRHYCAADMENFGDVLYGLLVSALSNRRSGRQSIIENFGFIAGPAALRGGFDVQSIRKLFRPDTMAGPLMIGGGDILRLDDEAVGSCYQGRYRELVDNRPSECAPILVGKSADGRHSMTITYGGLRPKPSPKWFHQSYMPPTRGAFLLSPGNCPAASAVAYVSAGVPFHISPIDAPAVRPIFDAASGIWVRDELSRDKLLAAGVTREIVVAPDLAVLTEALIPRESLQRVAMTELQRMGLDGDEGYLCFQVNSTGTNFLDSITQSLHELSRNTGMPVVLLPLGFCHGDREILQKIHRRLPETTRYADVGTVHEMLALIAWSKGFAGVSMHGNIVAFSYGVPPVFAPLDVEKIAGVMRILRLHASQRLERWENLPGVMTSLVQGREMSGHGDVLSELQAQVYRAFDRSMEALGLAD